jgi:hypothetical protein
MEKGVKNLVGFAIIIALIAFSYAILSFTSSFSKSIEPSSFRSFTVSAEGEEIAVPDVAEFTFTVLTEGGTDIGSLQEENTTKMNKAIEFVKENGVDSKDIKTERYNLSPRYQRYNCEDGPCPPAEIVGYEINQTVNVKIRDFEKVGEILGGIVDNGANQVSRLNFTIDDPTEVENVAREEAIEKAEAKAKSIAKAGNFKLGRLLSIQEGGGYYRTMAYNESVKLYDTDIAGAGVVSSVEPGSEEVTINVTLNYEIK